MLIIGTELTLFKSQLLHRGGFNDRATFPPQSSSMKLNGEGQNKAKEIVKWLGLCIINKPIFMSAKISNRKAFLFAKINFRDTQGVGSVFATCRDSPLWHDFSSSRLPFDPQWRSSSEISSQLKMKQTDVKDPFKSKWFPISQSPLRAENRLLGLVSMAPKVMHDIACHPRDTT
jgi:hypothetical protein